MDKINKQELLKDFINKFKYLPSQGSKEWLQDRKFKIGGSEMGTIAGHNPYKNIRGLVEGHLGITVFNGNINTYWGSILEDLVTNILEKKWDCKIHETGSLPGVIDSQGYSPDGLVYLESLDKIVLIEIKSAARRIANGKIPRMYKPQIYTGLDTIQIADMGYFVDAMFRRCSLEDLMFNNKYDTIMHPDKPLGLPQALCMICIYEVVYSSNYDNIKKRHGKEKEEWIDAGKCGIEDIELILGDTSSRKLKFFIPHVKFTKDLSDKIPIESERLIMFNEFEKFVVENKYEPIAIMPLKLFRMDIIPVERNDWKKTYNRKTKKWELNDENNKPEQISFVKSHQNTIEIIINQIKQLDEMKLNDQLIELDKLYPPVNSVSKDIMSDLINSLMF
jgi:hypothetical protein